MSRRPRSSRATFYIALFAVAIVAAIAVTFSNQTRQVFQTEASQITTRDNGNGTYTYTQDNIRYYLYRYNQNVSNWEWYNSGTDGWLDITNVGRSRSDFDIIHRGQQAAARLAARLAESGGSPSGGGADPATGAPGGTASPADPTATPSTPSSSSSSSSDSIGFGTSASDLFKGESDLESVPTLIKRAFDILIIIASVIFVVLLLIGGLMYLTSFGNDEQSKKAKTLLLDAVIGLAITVTAWAAGNYVLKLLGLDIKL